MKAIVILMDTLNRHMLKLYNPEAKAETPNIDRLARRCAVFDSHFIGSAPCMPARRDMYTGRLNFLERGWGGIEPYDVTLQETLRMNGIYSHISTDHTHYVELGGEGYLQQFDCWDIIRGQEMDCWISRVNRPATPEPHYGKVNPQYCLNRTAFHTDADFPSPKTFASAVDFLQNNRDADNYFLMVEAFDPHEPFDTTEEFQSMYPDDYQGPHFDWPGYNKVKDETPEAIEHLKNCYCATLSMADRWLGKLLDELDAQDAWQDTMVILTSDHGHLLGEHNFIGKNRTHAYNEMAHIPLMVYHPDLPCAGRRISALTQNIDIMPTLLEYFQCEKRVENAPALHGRSWIPLLNGSQEKIRDYAIYGWFGMPVNITDGRYTYFRSGVPQGNQPLYAYMSICSSLWRYLGRNCPEKLEMGRFLKYTKYPVYRMPVETDDIEFTKDTLLFDLASDPGQLHPLQDPAVEEKMCHALCEMLVEHDSPDEQFIRLGLTDQK